MKKMLLLLIALLAMLDTAIAKPAPSCKNDSTYCKWLAYFGPKRKVGDFQPYNPIVFDADNHPPLQPLRNNKTLLGYLSLGEVTTICPYFQQMKAAGALIGTNPHHPGSWYVDVRDTVWRNFVIKKLIPDILKQGFSGLFLDTVYSSIYLEQLNPAGYRGMKQAIVSLIAEIRNAYPKIPLMMNKGYQVLPQVGGYLNYALGDSLLTQYNSLTGQYEYVPLEQYLDAVTYLQDAMATFPKLVVMSLDYWNPQDPCGIKQIYEIERMNGFRPYVTAAGLQQITPEP